MKKKERDEEERQERDERHEEDRRQRKIKSSVQFLFVFWGSHMPEMMQGKESQTQKPSVATANIRKLHLRHNLCLGASIFIEEPREMGMPVHRVRVHRAERTIGRKKKRRKRKEKSQQSTS